MVGDHFGKLPYGKTLVKHVRIYIYTYTHAYIYIYTHIEGSRQGLLGVHGNLRVIGHCNSNLKSRSFPLQVSGATVGKRVLAAPQYNPLRKVTKSGNALI